MPVLWPGHRWEDYQVRLIDNAWNPTDELGTTFKMRGVRSLYGQFKGELTFALDKRDPHAQFLLERENHFIQVLRDGRKAFEGFQIKLDREDTVADAERWIEFAFLPLAFLLRWRVGMAAGIKLDWNGPLDDNFKEIVRFTIGPAAPTTPTPPVLARIMPDFSVQANASLAPAVPIDATGAIIYEIIQQYAAAHQVDWDIVFDADFHPEFRTYYPRRGTDRTEGGPGPDSARCIFSDDQGNFVKQSYGTDTSDFKSVVYDRLASIDVAAGPARIAAYGLREAIIDSGDAAEMQVALTNADLKEWYKLEEFKEQEGKQWQEHFFVGDEVTWKANRLGYGPHDDCLCMMEFEIDEAGFEILTPTFGKPEPDIRDNLRGGGRGKRRPNYTPPTIWHLYGDAATLVDPDADNAIGVIGGLNISVTEGANLVTIDGTGPAAAAFVAPAFTFDAAHVIGASGNVVHSDSVVALGITAPDANTVYPLPAGPNRWSFTSGGTVTITAAVANQVNFEVAAAALPYAVPALTFGAAHAAGAANSVLRTDAVVALGITCPDANTVYPLPAGPNRWALTSAGGTVAITGAVANQVNFEVVAGAGCTWVRDDLDSGAGVISGLHTGVAAEPVMIGADDANLTATPWVGTSGGTKLDVRGLVRVVRGLYCNEASLALWGMDGGIPKVHIVDETAAVGGAGGGACLLDIYNAAIRHVMLDSNIANASYVWGIWENRDGAGAICNSFNAVTGAIILNEQQLGTGDIRWESTGVVNGMFLDATQGNAGFGRVPTVQLDVYRAAGVVAATLESGGATNINLNLINTANTWQIENNGATASFRIEDITGGTVPFNIFQNAPTNSFRLEATEVVINDNSVDLDFRVESDGNTRMLFVDAFLNAVNIGGAAVTQRFHVVGGDIDVDTGSGYRVNNTAANRHVLIGNGTRGAFRALVAADLGGHVHVITFTGTVSDGGINHNHAVTGNTANYTPALNSQVVDASTPVGGGTNLLVWAYLSGAAPGTAAWHYAWAKSGTHLHAKGTLATVNESGHTHIYDKTDTPTQGPT